MCNFQTSAFCNSFLNTLNTCIKVMTHVLDHHSVVTILVHVSKDTFACSYCMMHLRTEFNYCRHFRIATFVMQTVFVISDLHCFRNLQIFPQENLRHCDGRYSCFYSALEMLRNVCE